MEKYSGLPSFFQPKGTTVLESLNQFDALEAEAEEQNESLDALLGDALDESNDLTFGDETFGDLKAESLPDFFTTPKKYDDEDDLSNLLSKSKEIPATTSKLLSAKNEGFSFGNAVMSSPPAQKSLPPPGLIRKPATEEKPALSAWNVPLSNNKMSNPPVMPGLTPTPNKTLFGAPGMLDNNSSSNNNLLRSSPAVGYQQPPGFPTEQKQSVPLVTSSIQGPRVLFGGTASATSRSPPALIPNANNLNNPANRPIPPTQVPGLIPTPHGNVHLSQNPTPFPPPPPAPTLITPPTPPPATVTAATNQIQFPALSATATTTSTPSKLIGPPAQASYRAQVVNPTVASPAPSTGPPATPYGTIGTIGSPLPKSSSTTTPATNHPVAPMGVLTSPAQPIIQPSSTHYVSNTPRTYNNNNNNNNTHTSYNTNNNNTAHTSANANVPPPNIPIAPSMNTTVHTNTHTPSSHSSNSTPSTPVSTTTNNTTTTSAYPQYPKAKYMLPSDIRFVVGKVLQPLESQDPYADDYYFLQLNIKKNMQAREQAMKHLAPPPPLLQVPLPTWKETKERIKGQLLSSREVFEQKTREWEEKEQVLGHRMRAEISKPREQLALPSLQDLDFDINDDDEMEWKAPFTSRLWTTRVAVQQGYEALFSIQELQYMMTSPVVASNPLAMDDIRKEMANATQLLSQSLGIRIFATPNFSSSSFFGDLPNNPAQLQSPTALPSNTPEFQLDGRHLAAILQTIMGKKLLCRGLKFLNPNHRWSLVPVVLARTIMHPLSTAASSSSSSSSSTSTTAPPAPGTSKEHQEVEKKLLKTIIEYLQFSYQHQQELLRQQQQQGSSSNMLLSSSNISTATAAMTFTNDLLRNLRVCIKNVVIAQTEKYTLREMLFSEQTRSEIMHVIVQVGDSLCPVADTQLAEEWTQTRDAFMSFLDNY